jgi:hypothetical protein
MLGEQKSFPFWETNPDTAGVSNIKQVVIYFLVPKLPVIYPHIVEPRFK